MLDATSASTSPSGVLPGCTSQGRIIKTAATMPMPQAIHLARSIFSVVKRWAISIVKSGFRQMIEDAVAALQ